MPKPSHREKLIAEGLNVVLTHGYNRASVRDIVRAADVPLGSFTNHFASKEQFAREVLDRYYALVSSKIDHTLRNEAMPPLRRLRKWLDLQIEFLELADFRSGCLIGNFTMEASGESGPIRQRLREIITDIESAIAQCLRAAIRAGEVPGTVDAASMAGFIYASWQGAILQAKVEQRAQPVERFKKVLFKQLLH